MRRYLKKTIFQNSKKSIKRELKWRKQNESSEEKRGERREHQDKAFLQKTKWLWPQNGFGHKMASKKQNGFFLFAFQQNKTQPPKRYLSTYTHTYLISKHPQRIF